MDDGLYRPAQRAKVATAGGLWGMDDNEGVRSFLSTLVLLVFLGFGAYSIFLIAKWLIGLG